ncbi:hypothetical protein GGQ68_004564 [Sagittula marina]|uniref:NADH dehydrogenase subunit E n=1 Tax=Sagittula marina TaxID=943940 RepID=A0A7W6DS81_9RHOB|nr:hypothetical protein [Sagittula marina]MBB3988208.1 hypothetical protein [Sagittula marina]
MMKLVLALPALALTAGCVELGMAPEGATPEVLAAWDASVASIGCDLVNESDYLPVELQTGLPREKVIEIAQYKVARDQAVSLENGGVRSVVGACVPVTEPAIEVAQAG